MSERRMGEDRRAPVNAKQFNHYFKDVRHLDYIDVYRVCALFGVTDPCLQHALKKLLCTGNRGVKAAIATPERDIKEVIASCQRFLEMQLENEDRPIEFGEPSNDPVHVVIRELSGQQAEPLPVGESGPLPGEVVSG